MEKKINIKALIISLIFALISCGFVFGYINSLEKPVPEIKTIKLLVASRNMKVGEEIKPEDISTIDVPEDSLPEGVINDRKSIEGMYIKEAVIKGEPFLDWRRGKSLHYHSAFQKICVLFLFL